MKTKQRPKRRARTSLGRRIRTFWILIAFLAAATAYGTWALAKAPVFYAKSVDVVGLARVSRADVLAKASIDPTANVWLLDARSIEARVASLPYVATARIHRRPLASLRIDVVERERDGCAQASDGRLLTIDAERRILEAGCADDSLPKYLVKEFAQSVPGAFLDDPALAQLQGDAHALASDGRRYAFFGFDAFGELEAVMPDGIRVRFGEDADLQRKDRMVGPILAQLGPRAAQVASVDLRAPATPVVRFRGR